MSDSALARVIATALEAAREMDDARVRAIVREELSRLQAAPQPCGWISPPQAAKSRGISLKRVRALIEGGAVQVRQKNAASKQPKLELNLASLDAALAGDQRAPVVDASSWAAQRARKAAP